MKCPATQIQFERFSLICCCRSTLLFSFFFPSELEINNSARNRSVLVANRLTSHPISLFFSLSCLPPPHPRCRFSPSLLLPASYVSTFVCLLCVCVYMKYFLDADVDGDSLLFSPVLSPLPPHPTPHASFSLPFLPPSVPPLPQILSVVEVT